MTKQLYTFKFTYQMLDYWPPKLALERTVRPRRRETDKPYAILRHTSVIIFSGSGPHLVAMGDSRQSHEDQDVRETGRKMAIRNALRTYVAISKQERTYIWDSYFALKDTDHRVVDKG